jgi:hypothetical protein
VLSSFDSVHCQAEGVGGGIRLRPSRDQLHWFPLQSIPQSWIESANCGSVEWVVGQEGRSAPNTLVNLDCSASTHAH